LKQVRLPLSLRTFVSGFTAIQSAAHSEDAVCAAITKMVQPKQQQQQQQPHEEPSKAVHGIAQHTEGGKVVVLPAHAPSLQVKGVGYSLKSTCLRA